MLRGRGGGGGGGERARRICRVYRVQGGNQSNLHNLIRYRLGVRSVIVYGLQIQNTEIKLDKNLYLSKTFDVLPVAGTNTSSYRLAMMAQVPCCQT